jgi:hypothetical protein
VQGHVFFKVVVQASAFRAAALDRMGCVYESAPIVAACQLEQGCSGVGVFVGAGMKLRKQL